MVLQVHRLLTGVFMMIFILNDIWIHHRIILMVTKMVQLLHLLENYKGKLYMIHGDMDDNVHFQNSIYLISRLEDDGKDFRVYVIP